MKHLNDWDQHLIQWNSEAELVELSRELAEVGEHTGQVVKSRSLLGRLLGIAHSEPASEMDEMNGEAPASPRQVH